MSMWAPCAAGAKSLYPISTNPFTLWGMNKALSLVALIAILGGVYHWNEMRDPFAHAPIGLIDSDPVQTDKIIPPFAMDSFDFFKTSYLVTPLSSYDIKARVLAKTRYYSDDMAGDIVPYDFGLGWRSMSEIPILSTYFTFEHKSMSGGMRGLWVSFKKDGAGGVLVPPADFGNIQIQYSNNHLIPANTKILHKLGNVKTGDMVHLKGYLVKVEDPARPGHEMTSSTSRNDTATHWGGNNSNCEVMLVTEASRIISTMPYAEEPLPEGWW